MPAALGRHAVLWDGITGSVSAPPAPATLLRQQRFAVSGARAFGYEGFSSAGITPATPTITIKLVDAASAGSELANLTDIQWGWWDSASDLADTFGVNPTNSGTAESTDGSGTIVLAAASSTKTSGQQAFVMLHDPTGPRTFGALLTVD